MAGMSPVTESGFGPPLTPQQVVERKLDGLAEMIGATHEAVESRQIDVDAIRIAVRDGIVSAASDREVWRVALETLVPIAREHAQAESRYIKANGGLRSRTPIEPWLGAFKPSSWNRDALLDFVVPVVVCGMALAALSSFR
jgi:hypothetical protein